MLCRVETMTPMNSGYEPKCRYGGEATDEGGNCGYCCGQANNAANAASAGAEAAVLVPLLSLT
mgnify:CR=1 FL=1